MRANASSGADSALIDAYPAIAVPARKLIGYAFVFTMGEWAARNVSRAPQNDA